MSLDILLPNNDKNLQISSSVRGVVQLLKDTNLQVVASALDTLLMCVEENWHEIAEGLVIIEDLALNKNFAHHKKASLLAAKIMYHLNILDEALMHAMKSQELLKLDEASEFIHTIVAEAIQRYCSERQDIFDQLAKECDSNDLKKVAFMSSSFLHQFPSVRSKVETNLMFESLVHQMIEHSCKMGEAGAIRSLGIALEARRLDLINRIIMESPWKSQLLKFCSTHSQKTISSKRFRTFLQHVVVELYEKLFPFSNRTLLLQEYVSITRALAVNEDDERLANLLASLVKPADGVEKEDEILLAYQIAFDLVTFENQVLLTKILNHPCLAEEASINKIKKDKLSAEISSQDPSPGKDTDRDESIITSDRNDSATEPLIAKSNSFHLDNAQNHTNGKDLSPVKTVESSEEQIKEVENNTNVSISRLRQILSGDVLLNLTVNFLYRENHTNLLLLNQIKNSVDPRSSVTPNGIVICHAFMQCGTTSDVFVRENLEWFGRAVCWAKFTVAAANGVLHKGHTTASKQVLSAYLPGSGGGPYSEGGSLMALGLIHANRFNIEIRQYLLEQLKNAQTYCPQNYEPLQHGACIGLGLLGMGSNDEEILMRLKEILFADTAVAGESAGIAIGMVSLGSGSSEIAHELLKHAHETEHERSVRGSALGVAFLVYRKEEESLTVLQKMIEDKDPMIRYGGMFGIGMAYCGTSNNVALRRLLHTGVSDASNDVRRAAVMSIGFVACDSPNQVPRIVGPLADSFNPHVRYAAAIAVGVGCCGKASSAALKILLPLTQDTTDFVRQGALLGLGLLLVQASSTALLEEKVQSVRDLIVRVAADKHEDTITRFGAIVSQGLIDMGGRNGTISFYSLTNAFRSESAVGLAMFCQLWFWYPYILIGSLAFQATALIGLAPDLTAPSDFRVGSLVSPGTFSYIEPVEKTEKKEKSVVVTAVLSGTSRRRQHEQMRKLINSAGKTTKTFSDYQEDVEMVKHVAVSETDAQVKLSSSETSKTHLADTTQKKHISSLENLPSTLTLLRNPCRVVALEEKYILVNFPESAWVPFDLERKSGVVMLKKVVSKTSLSDSQDVDMTQS